jgi:hypothetical protein
VTMPRGNDPDIQFSPFDHGPRNPTGEGPTDRIDRDVTRIDAGKVTVTLGTPVTVDVDKVRLVQSYVPPKRKRALIDDAD